MLLDILKIVLPFLGGGLAGALLNEWFRLRNARVQPIPLIERVNRLVNPDLKGITLARLTGDGQNRRLEEIKNVREYQFTLRNTSTIHLQDVEIQFEFPTEDVEGWAGRPALSKTAPVLVDAATTEPWRKGYRWHIPQLPSTDSIEFTFRAVEPASDDYEVALYKIDRVVIEKSKGEPTKKIWLDEMLRRTVTMAVVLLATVALLYTVNTTFGNESHVVAVNEAGCSLTVISSFKQLPSGDFPWQGPWAISYRILNTGTQKCVLQSDQFTGDPLAIEAARELIRTAFSPTRPELIQREISLGPDSPVRKIKVTLYGEVRP